MPLVEKTLASTNLSDSDGKDTSSEASRREHLLVVRLATKEQELQELSNQISELKAAQAPTTTAMRNALLDPAVNIIVSKLTQVRRFLFCILCLLQF